MSRVIVTEELEKEKCSSVSLPHSLELMCFAKLY